ncbi:hypothetical protein L7F22_059211 [Adiantum nelumboides]|nr:hypothetical protein [Adiantum nelumboides]
MAPNLFLCFTLLCALFSFPTCLSYQSDAPSSSSSSTSTQSSGHGSVKFRSFPSFLLNLNLGSRKLSNGPRRGRRFAEMGNSSEVSVAPTPSSNGKLGAEPKKRKEPPAAEKWLAGVALGAIAGAISAFLAPLLFEVIHDWVKGPKLGKPVVFQRKVIDTKSLAFLEKAGVMESLELLGKGGSGEVYKFTFENGTPVAIKRVFGLTAPVHGGVASEKSSDVTTNSLQIHAELNTLGQIRHRNLVTLLAYIPQPNAHLLIYDYMQMGSLHDVIIKVAEHKVELSWPQRLDIAKDLATGLKYLHFECDPRVIHCDLKPGNILLDKDMVAHIGDFGLAKVIPDKHTHITGNNLAGTVGYIAPEYYQTLRYTTKGDVYAFGVVLVVLLTGKEPTHSFFSEVHSHLGDWLADVLASRSESAANVLDLSLQGNGDVKEMLLALKLAAFCLHEDPHERPNADEVLKMLNQIRPSPLR